MNERRHRTLTDDDVDALACALHGGVPVEEHIAHHAAIKTWIERENRKAERAEKIKTQVGGWAVITTLSLIGGGAWKAWIYLKEHLK